MPFNILRCFCYYFYCYINRNFYERKIDCKFVRRSIAKILYECYETHWRIFGLKYARSDLTTDLRGRHVSTRCALSVLSCLLRGDITDPFISRFTLIFPPSLSLFSLDCFYRDRTTGLKTGANWIGPHQSPTCFSIAVDNLSFFRNRSAVFFYMQDRLERFAYGQVLKIIFLDFVNWNIIFISKKNTYVQIYSTHILEMSYIHFTTYVYYFIIIILIFIYNLNI